MMVFDDTGDGLPVLLIHGFPLNRRMWQPQVEDLSAAGFRVICPDLPGFGETPKLEGPVTMSVYADQIVRLMDHLEIEKSVVGGMSMGGYVLLNLLERYPERCLGAMFLVTRAAADDSVGREKREVLAREVETGNQVVVPETFAKVLFGPDTVVDRPELIAQVRGWMEATPPAGIVGGLLAMRDRADYVDRLGMFHQPALVLGAEYDLAVPAEHARVLAAGLPDAMLEIIPEAGHMANLEQPERFNRALLKFLEKRFEQFQSDRA